jgi:beta-glucanase (GH16 family)
MRRRSPFTQVAATGAALALAFPLAVRAESSAESASRTLNFEVRRDRAREGALDARAADRARATPATSPGSRQIDEDRAAVGGRPEEFGRSPQSLRWTGYNSNITR